jgi:hypothetical protein
MTQHCRVKMERAKTMGKSGVSECAEGKIFAEISRITFLKASGLWILPIDCRRSQKIERKCLRNSKMKRKSAKLVFRHFRTQRTLISESLSEHTCNQFAKTPDRGNGDPSLESGAVATGEWIMGWILER